MWRGSVVTSLITKVALLKSIQNRENCVIYLAERKTYLKLPPWFWILASVLLGMFREARDIKCTVFLSSNDYKWIILYQKHFCLWQTCPLPPYINHNFVHFSASVTCQWHNLHTFPEKYLNFWRRIFFFKF
jgi:hypothetical protein